jgi:hypothetical protein
MVITLTTATAIPAGSTIYVSFPARATEIAIGTNPMSIGGSAVTTVGTNHNNNSFSLTYANSIASGAIIAITTSIRSPSSIGSYDYVTLSISVGSTLYLSSLTTMSLVVDSVSSIPTTVTPATPTTGALSAYTISITINVPHPS